MNFTTTYKKNREIASLVDKLSKETFVSKSVILDFILNDLKRIYKSKIDIHSTTLKSIENEFGELNQKEQLILKNIEIRTIEINLAQKRIPELIQELEQKTKMYTTIQAQLTELREKLLILNSNLNDLGKEKKQIQYKVMLKSHAVKEKFDFSFKKLGWILTAFTIIAVILAILLIINK